jgi:hypothetical protein
MKIIIAHHDYAIRPKAPGSSFQNAPGKRPYQDVGAALQVMLRGVNLENKFWPFAFNYALQISNILPHGDRGVPLERLTGHRGSVNRYRTFWCLVIVKPPDKRNGKLESNFRPGIFLGFTGTLMQIFFWDLASLCVKRAYTIKYEALSCTNRPLIHAICVMLLMARIYLLMSMNTVLPPLLISRPHHAHSSNSWFLEPQIRCDHFTFWIESADCADSTCTYIANMLPNSTGAGVRGWRQNCAGAFMVELNN